MMMVGIFCSVQFIGLVVSVQVRQFVVIIVERIVSFGEWLFVRVERNIGMVKIVRYNLSVRNRFGFMKFLKGYVFGDYFGLFV